MTEHVQRELTRAERAAIRKLVVTMCANYDSKYGCMPLGGDCFMLGKWWTGAYCKYFRGAVLPLDTLLENSLTGKGTQTRLCSICGKPFPESGKQAYCSDACAGEAKKRKQRGYMRERRGNR